jgi:hypothetical protein
MPKKKSNGDPLKPREVCKLIYGLILSSEGGWLCVNKIQSAKTSKDKIDYLARYVSARDYEFSSDSASAKKLWAIAKWLGLKLPEGISFPNGWAKYFK